MRAAVYSRTGRAREVLSIEDVAVPIPGPGEVRVRVAWSGVNPSDVKTRGGLRSSTLPFPKIIPHSDGAGVIDAVGPDVPADRLGEAVWVWNAAWGRPFGTAAQWVAVPADQAVLLPAQVSLEVGACLGIPALTAYHAVAVNGGVAGKRVLIAGGAGAVGHYALQCARQMGASQIITTVSSAEKAAVASAAGADLVVNYKTEKVTDRIRQATAGQGVDRIIEVDIAANMLTDLALTTPTGEIIVYGSGQPNVSIPFYPAILNNLTLHFFMVYKLPPADRTRAIAALTAMLATNSLQHRIAARLPLERIAEAHELVETGQANGNVILDVGR